MIIKIKNLQLKALIGIHDFERTEKQAIIINLKIECDERKAVSSDNITDTLNYEALVTEITEQTERTQFNLLEKLADFVLGIVMKKKSVTFAEVEIDKPDAPIKNIDSVSITVGRFQNLTP